MALIERLKNWLQDFRDRPPAGNEETQKLSRQEQTELLAYLQGERPALRWLAAEALGEANPGTRGVEALAATMADPDPILRWEAAMALARLGTPAAKRALLATAATGASPAQAVALIASRSLPMSPELAVALLAALESSDPEVRLSAADALAAQALPEAQPQLLQLLESDPDPLVRRAAAVALGRQADRAAVDVLAARAADGTESRLVREAASRALDRLSQAELTAEPANDESLAPDVDAQAAAAGEDTSAE